ncbi:MAG TPA: hypothetical protein DC038_08430 [Clostridiales bacterium]|nr:hypothetical protein [Clostridiales bacterium]
MKRKGIIFVLVILITVSAFEITTLANAVSSDTTPCSVDGAQPTGYFISMKAGDGEVFMQDGIHTFKNVPFISNDIAYVPLRETVELCGGIVRYNEADKSVLIAFPPGDRPDAKFSQIWVGNSRVLNNASEENPLDPYLYKGSKVDNYVPIFMNGSIFVPATYFERLGLGKVFYDVQSSVTLISSFDSGDYLAGFKCDTDFSLLDKSIRERFKFIGREEIDSGALIEDTFSDGDVELVIRTGEQRYIKHEGVKEEIHMITLISDKYCTLKGLRVGDSAEMVLRLYGITEKWFTDGYFTDGRIKIWMQDGKVARFSIFSMD